MRSAICGSFLKPWTPRRARNHRSIGVVASILQVEADVQLPVVEELKRRRVFRALVAYGIAAFAVLQIVEPISHALHLPDATRNLA